MQQIQLNIGGNVRRALCYVVKVGEANDIVIPAYACSRIDLVRLNEIEAKGGEMLAQMRDTRLDNGMNALVQYESLFAVVPKAKPKPAQTTSDVDSVVEPREQPVEPAPKRRGRQKRDK